MTTCIDLLNRAMSHGDGLSAYALAKKLGLSHQRLYQLLKDGGTIDDSTAISLANLLEVDPAVIVAIAHSERAKSDAEKAVWKDIFQRLGGIAA